MINLTPQLRESERVIREAGATVYMVRNGMHSGGSNIRMFLTDQRLILKAGLGPQRALPLSGITKVSEEKLGFYTMMRVDFDNGRVEWFTVQDQSTFMRDLEEVRLDAPKLPYEAAESTAGTAKRLFGLPLIFMAIVFGVGLICMVGFMLVFVLLMATAGGV
jgi:hypothetical protein